MRAALIIAVAVLLTQAAAASALPRTTAFLDTDERRVRLTVEVADEANEWRVGLMNRRSLAPNAGMVFLFPRSMRGGFWMKNTLIPLSIAFVDAGGRILRILDMEPCRADSCPIYDPGVAYLNALEVNRGAFAEWGVEEGDRLTLER